jgi:hypothetical protein
VLVSWSSHGSSSNEKTAALNTLATTSETATTTEPTDAALLVQTLLFTSANANNEAIKMNMHMKMNQQPQRIMHKEKDHLSRRL